MDSRYPILLLGSRVPLGNVFLKLEPAIIDKRRIEVNIAEVMHIIGDVEGRHCTMVGDLIYTGGTLVKGAEALMQAGAKSVRASATHRVFSGRAIERIENSVIDEVVVGIDSIPLREDARECFADYGVFGGEAAHSGDPVDPRGRQR